MSTSKVTIALILLVELFIKCITSQYSETQTGLANMQSYTKLDVPFTQNSDKLIVLDIDGTILDTVLCSPDIKHDMIKQGIVHKIEYLETLSICTIFRPGIIEFLSQNRRADYVLYTAGTMEYAEIIAGYITKIINQHISESMDDTPPPGLAPVFRFQMVFSAQTDQHPGKPFPKGLDPIFIHSEWYNNIIVVDDDLRMWNSFQGLNNFWVTPYLKLKGYLIIPDIMKFDVWEKWHADSRELESRTLTEKFNGYFDDALQIYRENEAEYRKLTDETLTTFVSRQYNVV